MCGFRYCQYQTSKDGLTNTSFSFDCQEKYVYRHPGRGTENYIDRANEAASMEIAAKLKIDRTFVAMNKDEGWKISEFIPNASNWIMIIGWCGTSNGPLETVTPIWRKTEHSFDQFEGIDDFRENWRLEIDSSLMVSRNWMKLFHFSKIIYRMNRKQVVLCHGDSIVLIFIEWSRRNDDWLGIFWNGRASRRFGNLYCVFQLYCSRCWKSTGIVSTRSSR